MNNKIKTIVSISILIVLLLLNSCSSTKDWKTFEIDGYGSLKVPENWECSVVDGFVYFSTEENGESKIVLAQYRDDDKVNKHYDEIEEMIWMIDENFSNSTGIVKRKICYKDGTTAEKFTLYFTGPNFISTVFLCLDESISEDTLKNIAKSYIMSK